MRVTTNRVSFVNISLKGCWLFNYMFSFGRQHRYCKCLKAVEQNRENTFIPPSWSFDIGRVGLISTRVTIWLVELLISWSPIYVSVPRVVSSDVKFKRLLSLVVTSMIIYIMGSLILFLFWLRMKHFSSILMTQRLRSRASTLILIYWASTTGLDCRTFVGILWISLIMQGRSRSVKWCYWSAKYMSFFRP